MSLAVPGFHRPWYKVAPLGYWFQHLLLCKIDQGQGQFGWKPPAKDSPGHKRGTKRRRSQSGTEVSGSQREAIMFAKDKYVKPTLRIWKWKIINQTCDISGVWPLLIWSPTTNYTAVLPSITVKEEPTKPLNNYLPYRFVSFISFFQLCLRRTYSSCQCGTCSFVTSHLWHNHPVRAIVRDWLESTDCDRRLLQTCFLQSHSGH